MTDSQTHQRKLGLDKFSEAKQARRVDQQLAPRTFEAPSKDVQVKAV